MPRTLEKELRWALRRVIERGWEVEELMDRLLKIIPAGSSVQEKIDVDFRDPDRAKLSLRKLLEALDAP